MGAAARNPTTRIAPSARRTVPGLSRTPGPVLTVRQLAMEQVEPTGAGSTTAVSRIDSGEGSATCCLLEGHREKPPVAVSLRRYDRMHASSAVPVAVVPQNSASTASNSSGGTAAARHCVDIASGSTEVVSDQFRRRPLLCLSVEHLTQTSPSAGELRHLAHASHSISPSAQLDGASFSEGAGVGIARRAGMTDLDADTIYNYVEARSCGVVAVEHQASQQSSLRVATSLQALDSRARDE